MKTNKNILVTGAAGFIGYHLFNRLSQQGDNVIGLDNFDYPCGAEIDCMRGDVRDATLIDKLIGEIDVVYHLAAQSDVNRSYIEPDLTFKVNVGGTENVLKACKKHKKRLIFASSCEVYGTAQTKSISEEHPLKPHSPYAVSKKQAEEICIEYATKYKVRVSISRSFNIYGPFQQNDNYGAVIPVFVKRISEGEPPEISGNGTQTRDFMYINDALQAYEIMFKSDLYGKPINFGTGKDVSINSLANLIIKLFDFDLRPVYEGSRPNEVMKLRADISKARKLGFNPKMSLEDGLRSYIDWFKKED